MRSFVAHGRKHYSVDIEENAFSSLHCQVHQYRDREFVRLTKC
jgi:hypothetical protein